MKIIDIEGANRKIGFFILIKMTKFVMNENDNIMKTILKNARIEKGFKTRELAALVGVDQALVSKFESGDRFPTESQIYSLAQHLSLSLNDLRVLWLKEKILREVKYNPEAIKALQLVQEELSSYKLNKVPEYADSINSLLNEIDELKSNLDKLRLENNIQIADALELEFTCESNRIEGNTLTLRETDLVVNKGLTIAGKSMREHLEAINHNEAVDYIKELVSRDFILNERELLSIHNLILRGIHPEDAGRYRKVQVMISGSSHLPPQPYLVQKSMEDYFIWYAENRMKLHPVILAAEMHERLVTIHPFIDGNGRTSRLVMNAILLQNGYVIANIKGDADSRMKYYSALEAVQTDSSRDAFIRFIAEIEKSCLERYHSIVS